MGGLVTSWRNRVAWALALACFGYAVSRVLGGETEPLDQVFCISLLLAAALAIALPSGRPAFGLFAVGALAVVLVQASVLKLSLLHSPLMLPDLHYVVDPQTLGVLAHYRRMLAGGLVVSGAALGAAVLVWRWSGPNLWRKVACRRRRLTAAAISTMLLSSAMVLVIGPRGPFASLYALSAWDFLQTSTTNPLTAFFLSTTRMRPTIPEFDASRATALDWRGPSPPAAVATKPDILAVLEESTFPPRLLQLCDRAECDADLFTADRRTAASGTLLVHTFGGATWTTEFAFLSGLPHTVFGPAGIYAPYNLAPRLTTSLPRVLKAQGYRTVGIYPMKREFGNAANAYEAYGFDAFYDAADLNLLWESPDTEFAQRVDEIWQREREKAGTAPLFVFALTMRQHGPHADPLASLPPPFDRPLFPAADAATNLALGNYLSRLRQSDAAVKHFEQLVLDQPRPGVLLHFGDHQPAFDGLQLKLPKRTTPALAPVAYLMTYYMLKTSARAAAEPPPATMVDVAFLPGLLLEAAGLDPGPYFAANIRLRERCAARFEECAQGGVLGSYYAEVFDRQGILAR